MLNKKAILNNNIDLLFLLSICALFFYFAATNMYCTGMQPDEVRNGFWGIDFLEGKDIGTFSSVNIRLFGRMFPVNFMEPYCFALPGYMLLPVFVIFGINLFSLKLLPILFSLLSIILLYYICKRVFDRKVAIITTLLLATSHNFIYYTRAGFNYIDSILIFFLLAGFFFFFKYRDKKRAGFLYLASYLFGAGFSIKLSFAARLGGLLLSALIFCRRQLINDLVKSLKARQKLVVAACFCLGAFLFIYYNIVTHGGTFKLIKYIFNCNHSYVRGIPDNFDFKNNIQIRLHHLNAFIKEQNEELLLYIEPGANIFVHFLIIALISNLVLAFLFKRESFEPKKILFIYPFLVIMFLFYCFTTHAPRIAHMTFIYPFSQLTLAIFISYLSLAASKLFSSPLIKKTASIIILLIILLPVMFINMRWVIKYKAFLQQTCGNYPRSPLSYDISDYIAAHNIRPIMGMFGDKDVVVFITKKPFQYDYLFNQFWYADIYRQRQFFAVKSYASEHERFYFTSISCESPIKLDIICLGRKVILEKTFFNKARQPQFYLYRVE